MARAAGCGKKGRKRGASVLPVILWCGPDAHARRGGAPLAPAAESLRSGPEFSEMRVAVPGPALTPEGASFRMEGEKAAGPRLPDGAAGGGKGASAVAGLVRVELAPLVERIRAALEDFPQVAGAYLFGSVLGLCRPDSDIDLGLILEPGIRPDGAEGYHLEAAIALCLPPFQGHPFDIVLLDPGKPLFVFRVIKEGKLVYCRNWDRVTDVMEFVSRRYAEVYPRYRAALEEIVAEVMTGGPGP